MLEAEIPEGAQGQIDLAVFHGALEIASYAELRRRIEDTPRSEREWLMRGGVDGDNGTANFHALDPGTYSGCIGVKPDADEGHVACKTVELETDEPQIVALEPFDG